MIPKFRAKVVDDLLPSRIRLYEQDMSKYDIWMDNFNIGDHVFVTIEKINKRKLRSLEQNAYYWGAVVKILADEIGYTKDEMHEALRIKFLSYENVNGLPTMRSTTSLSTVEFEAYMESVRRWASMFHGIVIPEPNQTNFL